jgi:hypothetical protein
MRASSPLGVIGAVMALVGPIVVLGAWDLAFSVDSGRLYAAAFGDRDQPQVYLVRIAEAHRLRREGNRQTVRWMQRCLWGGLVGVVAELIGFALALAVH